jgi:peptidoglycan/LPS O-acetylase OafA/YrhL
MNKTNSVLDRYDFIDCTRGIAALMVILQHSLESIYPSFKTWSSEIFNFGVFGVTLFFLVSGYVIPISLERSGLLIFWVSRFFRLYPLYWLSILITVIFVIFGVMKSAFAIDLMTIIVNLSMLQEFVKYPHILALYWTLSMELVFYLLCSLLFLVPKLWHSNKLIYISIFLFLFFTILSFVFRSNIPLGRIQILVAAFVGMYSFKLVNRVNKNIPNTKLLLISLILLLTLIFAAYTRFMYLPPLQVAGEPVFTFFCIINSWVFSYFFFFCLMLLRNFKFSKILLSLGSMCYSLYLLHPFVMALIPQSMSPALKIFCIFGFTIFISWISWNYFESFFISVGQDAKKYIRNRTVN